MLVSQADPEQLWVLLLRDIDVLSELLGVHQTTPISITCMPARQVVSNNAQYSALYVG